MTAGLIELAGANTVRVGSLSSLRRAMGSEQAIFIRSGSGCDRRYANPCATRSRIRAMLYPVKVLLHPMRGTSEPVATLR